ncbi:uncharacterized protein LOC121870540 [Homarus americanus]|uniref:uncharacterized protein LOC121870540 n=1 Tax=Homarus americanus TaxID=6706 RepID=UPI001C4493B7|nr:uncharacterized protein LOC121870540 [Homarus americanus]
MKKFLRPERLDATPNSPTTSKEWRHWFRTFNSFLTSISALEPDKLATLCNFVSSSGYVRLVHKAEERGVHPSSTNYQEATVGREFGRIFTGTSSAQQGLQLKSCHSIGEQRRVYPQRFYQWSTISYDQTASQENKTLNLATAFDQARPLDLAQRNTESYLRSQVPTNTAAVISPEKIDIDGSPFLAATQQPKCYFCGGARLNRPQCPARNSTCHKCNKKRPFSESMQIISLLTCYFIFHLCGLTLSYFGCNICDFPWLSRSIYHICAC